MDEFHWLEGGASLADLSPLKRPPSSAKLIHLRVWPEEREPEGLGREGRGEVGEKFLENYVNVP